MVLVDSLQNKREKQNSKGNLCWSEAPSKWIPCLSPSRFIDKFHSAVFALDSTHGTYKKRNLLSDGTNKTHLNSSDLNSQTRFKHLCNQTRNSTSGSYQHLSIRQFNHRCVYTYPPAQSKTKCRCIIVYEGSEGFSVLVAIDYFATKFTRRSFCVDVPTYSTEPELLWIIKEIWNFKQFLVELIFAS